jgi:hypothetical protein
VVGVCGNGNLCTVWSSTTLMTSSHVSQWHSFCFYRGERLGHPPEALEAPSITRRPAMELTVHDGLRFHRPDRDAYERLVRLVADPELARDAVALLTWLQSRFCAGNDAVFRVPSMVRNRAQAELLVVEVQSILDGNAIVVEATPSLCGTEARRVRALLSLTPNNVLQRGVKEVIDSIGTLVFDDSLYELLWRYEMNGGPLPDVLAAPYRSCSAVGTPYLEQDDGRSLFVTFSYGEEPPLTQEEIKEYFAE